MFQESVVDSSLNRLAGHFGSRVVVRPPATAAELAELETIVAPLPRDVIIFLSTCDGLRMEIDGADAERHLWHIHEMTESMMTSLGAAAPRGFVPVRGDPVGERDWLAVVRGPANGAIVRWDSWTPGVALIASSFGHYLDGWSRYLVEFFTPEGHPVEGRERPPFDTAYVARQDPKIVTMQANPDIKAWLQQTDLVFAGGEGLE